MQKELFSNKIIWAIYGFQTHVRDTCWNHWSWGNIFPATFTFLFQMISLLSFSFPQNSTKWVLPVGKIQILDLACWGRECVWLFSRGAQGNEVLLNFNWSWTPNSFRHFQISQPMFVLCLDNGRRSWPLGMTAMQITDHDELPFTWDKSIFTQAMSCFAGRGAPLPSERFGKHGEFFLEI